jgi:tetratricopeptide (TPR) repeat protein
VLRTIHIALAATLLLTAPSFLTTTAAAGDILQLKDGRFVEGVPLEIEGDHIIVKYESHPIRLPLERVEDYFIEGAPPPPAKTDEERGKRASGLVRFDKRWVTVKQRNTLIKKQVDARRREMEDVRAHQEWRHRYKFATKNFTFESTLPPSLNERYSKLLEAYFAEFKKLWKTKVPKDWGKLKVCFYHDRDSFKRTAGASGGTLAYYRFVAPRELNFFYDSASPDDTVWSMLHEANHYLTDLLHEDFQYPHWINEAMAEYWSSARWDPETKKWAIGAVQEGRLVEVKGEIEKGTWYGLEHLLSNETANYKHYYWGWSFVHFMLESKKYQKRFKDFFVALSRAKNVDRKRGSQGFKRVSGEECLNVFLKRMKMKRDDLPALEEEWREYVNGQKASGARGLGDAGLSAYRSGRRLRAKRLLGEAIEAGSDSVVVHLRYAQLLRIDAAGLPESEKLLRRAVEIDPLAARAWAELGYTVYMQERVDEGKKYVALAREIDPDDPYLLIEIHEALVEHAEKATKRAGDDG